ncbi:adenylate/guanylate cyclase domain-containing protein [Granulosicoccus sp. 3-233]|uniref:adenylate/guanylate cyclase domain-containing protein n=1 Tax=Granulosicoccus sp. 3-233 TaxID=3417969 RepID=UPI003D33DF85
MTTEVQRKLTTILAADAAGFSRAMDLDEVSTIGALRAARQVFARFIERHRGRIVNTAGDGLIAEFPSVVEAVQCAIEVQNELLIDTRDQAGALRFRIGIHLGDVMIDGSDLLGEGVNLASRLESMAEPGGVLISRQVYDQVQKKLSVGFEYLGEKRPKNFVDDVSVYRISLGRNKPPSAFKQRKDEVARPSKPVPRAPSDLRERLSRDGRLLAALWSVLLLIDIASGSPFWAHWPGLVMAVFLAMKAAPLFASGWLRLSVVRAGIFVAGLLLVNLFSWSGYLWVIWPAAVLLVLELLRRLISGSR